MSDLAELVKTLEELNEYRETHKMEFYVPYPFQLAFHYAKEGQVYESGQYKIGEGLTAEERALICANQIGKTLAAGMETAFHATGLYPEKGQHFYPDYWPGTEPPVKCEMAGQDIYPNGWEGVKFDINTNIICMGKSNDSVMKVIQNELMGNPLEQPESLGTGSIPKDKIVKTTRKAGVPNAFSSTVVKHKNGKNSTIWFMAYEQDVGAMMGVRAEIAWPDEEPPEDVMSQLKRSQISRKKKAIYSTFTPESGITNVVAQLLNDMQPHQAVIRATWDDAPHMTKEAREKELSKFPVHERDMRSKGVPMMGSGLVFSMPDDQISIEPFAIPSHWPHICGIDFGIDHPFASVWIAWDRESDTIYIYDTYRISGALPPIHASAIKKKGLWMPVSWPHDGLNADKGSGIPLASLYRDEGLNLLPSKFSNPPSPNQKEGQGGNGIEVGLVEMETRLENGSLKVFSNLSDWFEEKRQYHRKDGKVVDKREDLMSASRYAIMSLRFASIKPQPRKIVSSRTGISNW